ncbi:MAG: site-specific DNA-methyltransferase [Candidatus Pacearchaeota archaeon]
MAKKDYSNWTKEELIKELGKFKKQKKYGIVWEDKPEQVALMCKEKLPVLTEIKDKEIITDPNKPTNLLIEGDNYHALSVLNYTHKGKIDVIYIDPPYNTGNEGFMYNDKIVDKEDAYRHSKWLSFMEKRLRLARNLLSDKGVIVVSIDDNEVAQLKLLCDEIFGEENFVAIFVRKNKAGSAHDSSNIAIEFDYMLCYTRNKNKVEFLKEKISVENDKKYKYEDEYLETRGRYYLRDLDYRGSYSKTLDYPIKTPDGTKIYAGGKLGEPNTWRWSEEKFKRGLKNGFIVFKKIKNKWKVYIKQYQFVDNEGNPREREIPFRALIQFLNSEGSKELDSILNQNIFRYPKPKNLIKFCCQIINSKKAILLDFFAGSGTTGHAVLELNKEDGGNRKFILCTNNENNICTDVCYPRIEKVIKGYKNLKGEKVEGLGGNLKYFKTDFVDANPTDKNKKKLVDESTEMLCLKEDCFDFVLEGHNFKIFKNNEDKYLGIIYDDDGIEPFKKEAKKLKKKFVVYVFSLDDSAREEEFEDLENVELKPIPAVILNVYKRIFRGI